MDYFAEAKKRWPEIYQDSLNNDVSEITLFDVLVNKLMEVDKAKKESKRGEVVRDGKVCEVYNLKGLEFVIPKEIEMMAKPHINENCFGKYVNSNPACENYLSADECIAERVRIYEDNRQRYKKSEHGKRGSLLEEG